MQLNNLEHITNFTVAKITRIVYLINIPRGNVTVILISIFYLIFNLFMSTFLTPVVRRKQ
jgi:hypothetical protein